MAFTLHTSALKVDGSIKPRVLDFIGKLNSDPTGVGLHIEPIHHSRDKRVRTGRVNDFWRAVLFKLNENGGTHWLIYGFFPHDKAIELAKKITLDYNPVSGVSEIHVVDKVDHEEFDAQLSAQKEKAAPVEDAPVASAPAADAQAEESRAEAGANVSAGAAEPPAEAPAAGPHDVVFGDRPLAETLGALTDEQLRDQLGLSPKYIAEARAVDSVDALLTVLDRVSAPEWQADALLDLAAGVSIDEVQAKLGIAGDTGADASAVDARDDDEKLLEGLRTPAARLTFADFGDDQEELRRVFEDNDFSAWRVFLHPEQRRYARQNYNGPFRLTGGAGTGKTVVLVHRAVRLAHGKAEGIYGQGSDAVGAGAPPRVVLTTFTSTLADSLVEQVQELDPATPRAGELGQAGMHIKHVDALVSEVLMNAGEDELAQAAQTVLGTARTTVIQRRADNKDELWQRVATMYAEQLPQRGSDDEFLRDEYQQIVLPNGITERKEYLRVRRPNRGVRLSRGQRDAVWDAFEAYRAQGSVEESVSWEESRHIAAAVLAARARAVDVPSVRAAQRRDGYAADHVLIDEGQDLTPGAWIFLRALAPEGRNDMFLAEDAHQRIYGKPIVLSRMGIQIVGRSRRLTLNYRTTRKILNFAMHILEGHTFVDADGDAATLHGYRSVRDGYAPKVQGFATPDEEAEHIGQLVRSWLDYAQKEGHRPEEMGILVRNTRQQADIVRRLGEAGVTVKSADRGKMPTGAPVVLTMHRAKGTEFVNVALMGVGEDVIPAKMLRQMTSEEAREDFLLRERSLLYVAATRARDNLYVTYVGNQSPMLPVGGA